MDDTGPLQWRKFFMFSATVVGTRQKIHLALNLPSPFSYLLFR